MQTVISLQRLTEILRADEAETPCLPDLNQSKSAPQETQRNK
jgi:hypothetical protein